MTSELDRLVDLLAQQRERVERAMAAQSDDYPDPKLAGMLRALSRTHLEVLEHVRLSRKGAGELTEEQAFQMLLDAGWRPPRGWVPPQGVVVPETRAARRQRNSTPQPRITTPLETGA